MSSNAMVGECWLCGDKTDVELQSRKMQDGNVCVYLLCEACTQSFIYLYGEDVFDGGLVVTSEDDQRGVLCIRCLSSFTISAETNGNDVLLEGKKR